MDITLDETQLGIQKTARDYATRVILPAAAGIDRDERFPRAELKGLADLGLMAVSVPQEYGGAGAGTVAYALAMQEVARACASTAVTMAVTNMVGEVIAFFGSEEQKKAYNPKLASGEYAAGSFALSEPGAGSDPGAMSTVAVKDGDTWVLDGQKQWITSGAHAGVMVVWARTGDRETLPGTRGISCFLVEGGTKGLHIGKAEDKTGIRGSNTVSLTFDGCRVPESALLGAPNSGFRIAMMALDGGRIGISSQAIGIARAALDESVAYAKDRQQFDEPISAFQGTQWKLADMATELDAANLLALRAAWLKEKKRPFSREASMAKVFASEAANRICNKAVQIHGGYGYTRDFPAERHLRDVRVTMIYEGTSEIQRLVISRSALA
ncbi:MAG: Butyryl-CoA dehydrogenase [Labilithrix sp.]|nr:Butyryl-CoA dehydrogenase [Labilithrix sp.]